MFELVQNLNRCSMSHCLFIRGITRGYASSWNFGHEMCNYIRIHILLLSGQKVLWFIFISLSASLLASGGSDGVLLVQFVQFSDIELGLLEGLDLLDDNVAQGIDELAGLLACIRNSIESEFLDQVNEIDAGSFVGEDIGDLLSDLLDLGVLSI